MGEDIQAELFFGIRVKRTPWKGQDLEDWWLGQTGFIGNVLDKHGDRLPGVTDEGFRKFLDDKYAHLKSNPCPVVRVITGDGEEQDEWIAIRATSVPSIKAEWYGINPVRLKAKPDEAFKSFVAKHFPKAKSRWYLVARYR